MKPKGEHPMATPDKRMIRRVVFASIVGSAIEWYDYFLYGVMAGIVFNKLYFASKDPVMATIWSYAVFWVGTLSRPFGAIIFGHFGDRIGRKSMLVLTLIIMGVATFCIGLVPTYAQIGGWATAILVLLRLGQGLGLGGEWGGAVLMTFEYASPLKRGLYASLPQIGLAIGLMLSTGIVALLSQVLTNVQFLAWGWRLAFLLSAILVCVGIWIRLNVMETPEFQVVKESKTESTVPFRDMWRGGGLGSVVAGLGVRYIEGVFFGTFAVFSIAYLTNTIKIPRTEAVSAVMVSAILMAVFIPLFGYLADRVGKAKLYAYASLITGFSAFPAFWLINYSAGNRVVIWLSIVIPLGIFWSAVFGPEAGLLAELFDTKVRYTGLSFTYQLSVPFMGGITPLVNTVLLNKFSGYTGVCLYCTIVGVLSALAALWIYFRQLRRQQQIALVAGTPKG
jgi:MFS family permease